MTVGGGAKLQLVFGDITNETTDIVVNTTNFVDFHIGEFGFLNVQRMIDIYEYFVISALNIDTNAYLTHTKDFSSISMGV